MLEAWSPDRKAQIAQSMNQRGAVLIAHEVIGDFDLTLWHYPVHGYHAASLNSGQEDPTTLSGQERQPKAQRLNWGAVKTQLHRWVDSYGKILIGSARTERIAQYRRLLGRDFLIGEWDRYPDAGFFIMPD